MTQCRWTSGSCLTATADDVFVTCELISSDRTTCVYTTGRYSDLGAHAKLTAVRKLGRRILQHYCTINVAEELLRSRLIVGHNAVSVTGTILGNVFNRLRYAVHGAYRDNCVEVLGLLVILV